MAMTTSELFAREQREERRTRWYGMVTNHGVPYDPRSVDGMIIEGARRAVPDEPMIEEPEPAEEVAATH